LHVGEVALLFELSKLGFAQSQLRPPLEMCFRSCDLDNLARCRQV
jgi:hypothetical protein